MPTLTNVSGGSGHLNELHSLILNEHWDLGTAYILTNSKAEIDIRFEGGVPIFSAACTRNAPLPFLKKLLYRLKDKEVRSEGRLERSDSSIPPNTIFFPLELQHK